MPFECLLNCLFVQTNTSYANLVQFIDLRRESSCEPAIKLIFGFQENTFFGFIFFGLTSFEGAQAFSFISDLAESLNGLQRIYRVRFSYKLAMWSGGYLQEKRDQQSQIVHGFRTAVVYKHFSVLKLKF